MEHKYRRIEKRILAGLVHLVARIICADRRISAEELRLLQEMEDHFGFDRTMMAEAAQLSLEEAVGRLKEVDSAILGEMMKSLSDLAMADRFVEKHEALLLVALKFCLSREPSGRIISGPSDAIQSSLNGSILYTTSQNDTARSEEIASQWDLIQLSLQRAGFQLMCVEKTVEEVSSMDTEMVRLLLGYLAPRMEQEQITSFLERMKSMDSATFCERILVDTLHLEPCRNIAPSLLIGLGGNDFLQLTLQGPLLAQLQSLLSEYSTIVTPGAASPFPVSSQQEFLYEGYGRLFFSLLVQAEPRKSSILLWPNKSEFQFTDAGLRLQLNQQEASLYTLILLYSTTGECRGLPLSFSTEQKRIERLYRSIYCRKKLIETSDVSFPDNLAPIRARIEKKMREQLPLLDNLEDYIPYNRNHDGFYRVSVPVQMCFVQADILSAPVSLPDFQW